MTKKLGSILRILQPNIEGISWSKTQYLSKTLKEHKIDILLLQETHAGSVENLNRRSKIIGHPLVRATLHDEYGTATYARNNIFNVRLTEESVLHDSYGKHRGVR